MLCYQVTLFCGSQFQNHTLQKQSVNILTL